MLGVMDTTTIIGRNGLVFSGVNEILNNRDNLPDGFDIVEDPRSYAGFYHAKMLYLSLLSFTKGCSFSSRADMISYLLTFVAFINDVLIV